MKELDRDQMRVVQYTGPKNMLVIAGPGSGKTRTLIERIAADIERGESYHEETEMGVRPENMVAITFTGAGAAEIKARLAERAPGVRLGFVGTLHAFLLQVLREARPGLGVIAPEVAEEILTATVKAMKFRGKADALKSARSTVNPPEVLKDILSMYYRRLLSNNVIDYDGILRYGLTAIKAGNTGWLAGLRNFYVDEYQDSGAFDREIYATLKALGKFLFIVGDPDQSIYGFRGSKLENILDEAKAPDVETFHLNKNYRSGAFIVRASAKLIGHNIQRVEGPEPEACRAVAGLFQVNRCETQPEHDSKVITLARAAIVDYKVEPEQVAVLTRTNSEARELRDHFSAAGMSTRGIETVRAPQDWKLCKAALAFFAEPSSWFLAALLHREMHGLGMPDDAAMEKMRSVYAEPGNMFTAYIKGMGPDVPAAFALPMLKAFEINTTTLAIIERMISDTPGVNTISDLQLALGAEMASTVTGSGVYVGTAHSAKGREWDTVIIAGVEEGYFPNHGGETEEERRLFYVAMTRAKNVLHMVSAASRKIQYNPNFSKIEPRDISRYVLEAVCNDPEPDVFSEVEQAAEEFRVWWETQEHENRGHALDLRTKEFAFKAWKAARA